MADLQLERMWVVYPGSRRFLLTPRIEAWPVTQLAQPPQAIESAGG